MIEFDLFNEYIVFSLNWSNILNTDPQLKKLKDKSFSLLDTSSFVAAGEYRIWWKAPFIDYQGYIAASNMFWRVFDTPGVISTSQIDLGMNHLPILLYLNQTLDGYDLFQLFFGETEWTEGNEIADFNIFSYLNGTNLLYFETF